MYRWLLYYLIIKGDYAQEKKTSSLLGDRKENAHGFIFYKYNTSVLQSSKGTQ